MNYIIVRIAKIMPLAYQKKDFLIRISPNKLIFVLQNVINKHTCVENVLKLLKFLLVINAHLIAID